MLRRVLDTFELQHSSAPHVLQAARVFDDGNGYLKLVELRQGAKKIAEHYREIGVVSDLDKTVVPPPEKAQWELPNWAYPGVAELFSALEVHGPGDRPGDVYYVTARQPVGVKKVPAWLRRFSVPAGTIDTGLSGLPHIAEREKIKDIRKILDNSGDQRFILFGDTNHRDPEVYRAIVAQYPSRIVAAFVHDVRPIDPERTRGLILFSDYAQVAEKLHAMGVLDAQAAARVVAAVRGAHPPHQA